MKPSFLSRKTNQSTLKRSYDVALKRALSWLEDPLYDEETRSAVRLMITQPHQLVEAFCDDLSFGTGGARGVMGVGTNRMNIYTVRKITQGLASYILKEGTPSKGVVIGFDSRCHSKEFAEEVAKVLMGNQIQAFLFSDLRPTPYISFTCRYLKAQAAVMITASHNPKEYNGYKIYWEDGGQIVFPHDQQIMHEISKITSPQHISIRPSTHSLPFIKSLPIDEAYLESLASLPFFSKASPSSLKICYTSLHGTGITLMPKALSRLGFSCVHTVKDQDVPDGTFPTIRCPNPEDPQALQLGIHELVRTQGDILLATDPDADRVAVVIHHCNQPVILSGHELAAIGAYFICQSLSVQKKLPSKAALVTTLVTTEILKKIGQYFGVHCFEVLTGFKYIGEKIHLWEQQFEGYQFLFGAEESYGYLITTSSRDKDGISAGCFFSEIAFRMQQRGKTLIDLLYEIYQRFGVHREKQFSYQMTKGMRGFKQVKQWINQLCKDPFSILGEHPVTEIEDYSVGIKGFPPSHMLIFRLSQNTKVAIRPSGTEPKLKIYLSTETSNFSSISQGIKSCDERLAILLQTLKYSLHVS